MYSSIVRDWSGYLFCNTDNNIGQTKPLISVCLKHWLGRLIAACCCCRHHNASVRLQSSHHTPASQPLNDRHVGHGDHRSQPCLPTKMSPPISECRHDDMPAYCTLNTIMSDGERFQIPNFQLPKPWNFGPRTNPPYVYKNLLFGLLFSLYIYLCMGTTYVKIQNIPFFLKLVLK